MQPTLVILAAGMGSRYGSLKQTDKLGPAGHTIIDYSMFDALKAGFGKIVFVIRRQIEREFLEVFGNKLSGRVPFEIVYQELDLLPSGYRLPEGRQKPWGTVHALWACRKTVNEPFVVINADDFYGQQAYLTLAGHLRANPGDDTNAFAMCGYKLSNTLSDHGSVTRGICKTNQQGYLLSIEEHLNIEKDSQGNIVSHTDTGDETLDADEIVSMNIWAFNPGIFSIIEEEFREFLNSSIHDLKAEMPTPGLIDAMIRKNKGKVKVLHSNAQWFGVTYAPDRERVAEKLRELTQQNKYPEKLW